MSGGGGGGGGGFSCSDHRATTIIVSPEMYLKKNSISIHKLGGCTQHNIENHSSQNERSKLYAPFSSSFCPFFVVYS